jgi:hypothetical protein
MGRGFRGKQLADFVRRLGEEAGREYRRRGEKQESSSQTSEQGEMVFNFGE